MKEATAILSDRLLTLITVNSTPSSSFLTGIGSLVGSSEANRDLFRNSPRSWKCVFSRRICSLVPKHRHGNKFCVFFSQCALSTHINSIRAVGSHVLLLKKNIPVSNKDESNCLKNKQKMRWMLIGWVCVCTYVYLYMYMWTGTLLSHFHSLLSIEQKGTRNFKYVLIVYVIKTYIHIERESNVLTLSVRRKQIACCF